MIEATANPMLGRLTGPIIKGRLGKIMDKPGSSWVLAGLFIGLLGTLMCGTAGRIKEAELEKESNENAQPAPWPRAFYCAFWCRYLSDLKKG